MSELQHQLTIDLSQSTDSDIEDVRVYTPGYVFLPCSGCGKQIAFTAAQRNREVQCTNCILGIPDSLGRDLDDAGVPSRYIPQVQKVVNNRKTLVLVNDEETLSDMEVGNRSAFATIDNNGDDNHVCLMYPNGGYECAQRFPIEPLDLGTPFHGIKRKVIEISEDELFDLDDLESGGKSTSASRVASNVSQSPSTPKSRKQETAAVRWCITYNNPTVTFREFCDFIVTSGDWKFFVGQEEIAPSSGTPHFQCYGETVKRLRTKQVHEVLAPHTCALKYALGSREHNVIYCSKAESRKPGGSQYQWFDESLTKGRGAKKTMDHLGEEILEKGITEEMICDHPGMFIRYGKQLKQFEVQRKLKKAKAHQKSFWKDQYQKHVSGTPIDGQQQRSCYLFFGPTSVGKTTQVNMIAHGELDIELYHKNGRTKWFDNYDYEEGIFLDEFNGSGFDIESINELTNRNDTYQAEIKGGSVSIVATHLFFASNRHPSDWWKSGDNDTLHYPDPRYQALARRFRKVYWWDDNKFLQVLENPLYFPSVDEIDHNRKIAKWDEFWRWKHQPAVAGYSFVTGDNSYFSLYSDSL